MLLSWLYLFIAIITELIGTTSMKLADGFRRFWPSVTIFVGYTVSLVFMTLALKKIDISIVYAVWSGLGTAAITAVGILWFREPVTVLKIASIALIIAGVIGLNLSGGHS
jgi:small multidrug resistance pump